MDLWLLLNLGVVLRFCPATTRGWFFAEFQEILWILVVEAGKFWELERLRRCGDEEGHEGPEHVDILLGEGRSPGFQVLFLLKRSRDHDDTRRFFFLSRKTLGSPTLGQNCFEKIQHTRRKMKFFYSSQPQNS
jgi:hypothetical protein